MIKLFESDLDGTLLNERHFCDEEIARGIALIHSQNKYLAAATGRNRKMMDSAGLPEIYPSGRVPRLTDWIRRG